MQNLGRTFVAAWSAALIGASDRAGAQTEHAAAPPASQTPDASVEAQGLAQEVRIETVLEIAERANPEIREAQERARSVGRATQQDVLRAVVDLSHWRGASRVGYMEQP
jgi:hypothetical protein